MKDDLLLKILYHQLQGSQKWQSVVIIENMKISFNPRLGGVETENRTKNSQTQLLYYCFE